MSDQFAGASAILGGGSGGIGQTLMDVGTLGLTSGQRAAAAQGNIAQAQLEQQRADRAQASKFAEASPKELAQIQKSIDLNASDIDRKQKLLDSSDPALIEAGKQALQLLNGKDAASLNPLNTNIAKQEQALRAKLQSQLGTGYENTTAGIQALQAFNEQANNARTGAQQSALGTLLGTAQDTSSRYGMQPNIANNGAFANLYGAINNRQVSAINNTPITGAGAQFVGDLQSARANTQFVNTGINAAATYAGAASGGNK